MPLRRCSSAGALVGPPAPRGRASLAGLLACRQRHLHQLLALCPQPLGQLSVLCQLAGLCHCAIRQVGSRLDLQLRCRGSIHGGCRALLYSLEACGQGRQGGGEVEQLVSGCGCASTSFVGRGLGWQGSPGLGQMAAWPPYRLGACCCPSPPPPTHPPGTHGNLATRLRMKPARPRCLASPVLMLPGCSE